eukprot:TRINITY_DN17485_c0_g1_i1.p1 TRINITY_DN17485_c0_g1~~TRINITY_DN17485_c0_g1_i1.p1  ORF type:complete len:286 (+),score=12.25 TRINITY_DN17485_c0_g1_i1:32-859(+)
MSDDRALKPLSIFVDGQAVYLNQVGKINVTGTFGPGVLLVDSAGTVIPCDHNGQTEFTLHPNSHYVTRRRDSAPSPGQSPKTPRSPPEPKVVSPKPGPVQPQQPQPQNLRAAGHPARPQGEGQSNVTTTRGPAPLQRVPPPPLPRLAPPPVALQPIPLPVVSGQSSLGQPRPVSRSTSVARPGPTPSFVPRRGATRPLPGQNPRSAVPAHRPQPQQRQHPPLAHAHHADEVVMLPKPAVHIYKSPTPSRAHMAAAMREYKSPYARPPQPPYQPRR